MPASTGSPIKTQVKKIDGLSVRYAESEPRDVAAILLSPWPESLYTFEQMRSRLAGPDQHHTPGARIHPGSRREAQRRHGGCAPDRPRPPRPEHPQRPRQRPITRQPYTGTRASTDPLPQLAGPNRVREVTRPAPAAHMLTGG
jgi:hypothetical protein